MKRAWLTCFTNHVRIRQYAYFGIFSQTLTSADITGRLGIEPDRFKVRGSRTMNPPVPKFHFWEIRSDQPGLTVVEHFDRIIGRLKPHSGAIGQLVQELTTEGPHLEGTGSRLQVVRHFDDEDGEDEELSVIESSDGQNFEKLPGQHQLLGWHLGLGVIEFLLATHADLDVDEYG
jgi:hypothetical protein